MNNYYKKMYGVISISLIVVGALLLQGCGSDKPGAGRGSERGEDPIFSGVNEIIRNLPDGSYIPCIPSQDEECRPSNINVIDPSIRTIDGGLALIPMPELSRADERTIGNDNFAPFLFNTGGTVYDFVSTVVSAEVFDSNGNRTDVSGPLFESVFLTTQDGVYRDARLNFFSLLGVEGLGNNGSVESPTQSYFVTSDDLGTSLSFSLDLGDAGMIRTEPFRGTPQARIRCVLSASNGVSVIPNPSPANLTFACEEIGQVFDGDFF